MRARDTKNKASMNKKAITPATANLTGKLDNSKVVKTCMGDQRRYQMLDEDSRYRKGAKKSRLALWRIRLWRLSSIYSSGQRAALSNGRLA